jgi:hypothetical protein
LVQEQKEVPILEPVWSRKKEIQSGTGLLQCRTEMMSAGMSIPAASALMPMPSYTEDNEYKIILLTVFPFLDHTIGPKYGMPSRIMYEHLIQFNNNLTNIFSALCCR